MNRLAIAIAVSVALAACNSPGDSESPSARPVEAVEQKDDQIVAQTPTIFDGNGLMIPAHDGGQATQVAFGTDRKDTERLAAPALGDAQGRSENDECGAGPMQFSHYNGITLNFQDGKFVGWSVDGGSYLPEGTRASLSGKTSLEKVEGSTLGEEYISNGADWPSSTILFDGPGEEAGVAHIWAGTNCVFR